MEGYRCINPLAPGTMLPLSPGTHKDLKDLIELASRLEKLANPISDNVWIKKGGDLCKKGGVCLEATWQTIMAVRKVLQVFKEEVKRAQLSRDSPVGEGVVL